MDTNKDLVDWLLSQGYADARVAKAMNEIDRKDFVPYSERELAYIDTPLLIGHDQTTSAPSMIASMLKSLDVDKGMKILEVGTGSGYQTAILSKLVGKKGEIISLELLPDIMSFAKSNLSRYKLEDNVELILASGSQGYEKEAPYDRIVYSAAAKSIPKKATEQLKDKGRMIVPVGGGFYQELYLLEKSGGKIEMTFLELVAFVPLKD